MPSFRTFLLRHFAWCAVLAVAALSACGGGQGGGNVAAVPGSGPGTPVPPPPPPPPPPPASSWTPKVADTWQWQLTGTINTSYNVTVYDVDLFDTPTTVLSALHSQGKYVICYFSAGSAEDWRPDYARFQSTDQGNMLAGWVGERWIDTRSANVRSIMAARLDLAKTRGCDGVEPDNVDAYSNAPGFTLTAQTQLDYNQYLATQAQARGMRVGLKNDVAQITALQPSFDFAINEQCHAYNECAGYSLFINAGKPVFNAEYQSLWVTDANARATLCQGARATNLRTLVLPLSLNDSFRYSCD